MPTIYDDSNYKQLIGDGTQIDAGGDTRLLAATPRPLNANTLSFATPFGAAFKRIPRNEWRARLEEQKAKNARCSDHCTWKALDQNGLPYCWGFGPTGAAITKRAMQGHRHKRLSASSICGPASNYRARGGWEGEALEILVKQGATTTDLYPEVTSRNANTPQTDTDRPNYKCISSVDCDGFDDFATMLLLGNPCPVAYNWWRHVVYLCDLVEIESNSWGFNIRNSWSDNWGDKNELGFGGFSILREGRGTPSSGFALLQMTAYL